MIDAGAGCVLRPLQPEDRPGVERLLAEPEVSRWWLRQDWDRVVEGDATSLAIVVDDELAGVIQYHEETDPDYLSASVDLFVGARFQGRRVGRRALKAVVDHLVGERGHHRITVDPAADNARAIHVYEALGFRRVGVLRAYERSGDGSWHDGLLMELVVE